MCLCRESFPYVAAIIYEYECVLAGNSVETIVQVSVTMTLKVGIDVFVGPERVKSISRIRTNGRTFRRNECHDDTTLLLMVSFVLKFYCQCNVCKADYSIAKFPVKLRNIECHRVWYRPFMM